MREEKYIEKNGRSIFVTEYFPENMTEPVSTVIFSHGFNGSHEDFSKECSRLNECGIGAICFDFCGGARTKKSSMDMKDMTVLTEKEDLKAVLEYAASHAKTNEKEIYLYGASQGGLVSALVAEEECENIAGLILIFPAFSIPDHWREMAAKFETIPEEFQLWNVTLGRKFYDTICDWDIFEMLGSFKKRVLLFHGVKDEVVPVEYARKATGKYSMVCYKEFPEEGHGFCESVTDEVIGDMVEFVAKKEVLKVNVKVTAAQGTENGDDKVVMIVFGGTVEGKYFNGNILPGGVDTQRITKGKCLLSARYMMAGKDAEGNECTLFVDNSGYAPQYGAITTKANIVTNCQGLSTLRQPLNGWIEGVANNPDVDIIIHLYAEEG